MTVVQNLSLCCGLMAITIEFLEIKTDICSGARVAVPIQFFGGGHLLVSKNNHGSSHPCSCKY